MEIFTPEETHTIKQDLHNQPFTFANGYFGLNKLFLSLEMFKNINLGNKTFKVKFEKTIYFPEKLHFPNFTPPDYPLIESEYLWVTLEFEQEDTKESIFDIDILNLDSKEEKLLNINELSFKDSILCHESYFEFCFNLWYQTKIIPLLKKINQQILLDCSDGYYNEDYLISLVNKLSPDYSL